MAELTNEIKEQIKKRRTFAIISHPDAGKTTLTEKFLLYGGAQLIKQEVLRVKRPRSMQYLTGWRSRRNVVFP